MYFCGVPGAELELVPIAHERVLVSGDGVLETWKSAFRVSNVHKKSQEKCQYRNVLFQFPVVVED